MRLHRQPAACAVLQAGDEPEKRRPLENCPPRTDTIEALARLLGVPESRTAEAVFVIATVVGEEERFVYAVVRGDMEFNETKPVNAVEAGELRPAREKEIRVAGSEPGYASPVGLRYVLVVADDADAAVVHSPNLVAGANEGGFHPLNVNHSRNFEAAVVTDLAAAEQDSACPECGSPMRAERGVEVGNIFKLDTRCAQASGAYPLDCEGRRKPVVRGSYGIGVGRLLAGIAEEHRGEDGLAGFHSTFPHASGCP